MGLNNIAVLRLQAAWYPTQHTLCCINKIVFGNGYGSMVWIWQFVNNRGLHAALVYSMQFLCKAKLFLKLIPLTIQNYSFFSTLFVQIALCIHGFLAIHFTNIFWNKSNLVIYFKSVMWTFSILDTKCKALNSEHGNCMEIAQWKNGTHKKNPYQNMPFVYFII